MEGKSQIGPSVDVTLIKYKQGNKRRGVVKLFRYLSSRDFFGKKRLGFARQED